MSKHKKFSLIAIGALLLILAFGLVAFAPFGSASAAASEDGFSYGHGPGGFRPAGTDNDEAIADALGISVEELQAAHETVKAAALEQAVAEGALTQEQADQIADGTSFNRGAYFIPKGEESDSLLAEALGISVEELQAARQLVQQSEIELALADGSFTEEQAVMMEAYQAVQSYMQKDEMIAKALGITVDELTAAQADGQRLPDLIEEMGFTQEEYDASMQALRQDALQQAVEDGVITQEQADLMLENGYHGLHDIDTYGSSAGRRGFERPEGFPGRPGKGETDFQGQAGSTLEG